MVFELVENSLHVLQENFMDLDKVAPPIRIIVADGLEDVTIMACSFVLSSFLLSNRESVETFIFVSNQKVSHKGGRIPRSGLPKIFTYLYSTVKNPLDEHSDIDLGTVTTMAGYGYGLPISRLYTRYFGGDLQIISMERYVRCSSAGPRRCWMRRNSSAAHGAVGRNIVGRCWFCSAATTLLLFAAATAVTVTGG
ncbi:[Pyruvate dehydrogenase (acetyl-transferring)] kinase [Abeliophyllum distichum]|uniref:Protein-serine/threonine kinase n=1 Tax=Abeliophyllum distichum TaxID=126358 RepID=A0ABD1U1P6_9LAMI